MAPAPTLTPALVRPDDVTPTDPANGNSGRGSCKSLHSSNVGVEACRSPLQNSLPRPDNRKRAGWARGPAAQSGEEVGGLGSVGWRVSLLLPSPPLKKATVGGQGGTVSLFLNNRWPLSGRNVFPPARRPGCDPAASAEKDESCRARSATENAFPGFLPWLRNGRRLASHGGGGPSP